MKKRFLVIVALLAMLLVISSACKGVARFDVISLDIAPPIVAAGDVVSVTAEVKNTGISQGVYTAILTVDGAAVERKDVTVAPGATETAAFSVVRDKPGMYAIAVEGLSSSITVNHRLVPKEMELKYDDGKGQVLYETSPWSSRNGYLTDFSPPSVPFTIKKLLIYGAIKLIRPPTG